MKQTTQPKQIVTSLNPFSVPNWAKKISVLLVIILLLQPIFTSCNPITKDNAETKEGNAAANLESKDGRTENENGDTSEPQIEHEHIFSEKYTYDKSFHFYTCECGEKNSMQPHEYNEWIVVKEASESADGQKCRECSQCDYIQISSIPGGNHEHIADIQDYDEFKHWNICSCGEVFDVTLHDVNNWTILQEATENATGMSMRECSSCEYQEFLTIPKVQNGEIVFEWKKVSIQNVATSQYMNYDYGELANGTPLRVWSWDGSSEQLFDIDNVSGNVYRILTNVSSSYAVDVYRNGKALAVGQLCDIWKTGDDTTAQNFKLYLCSDGSYIFRMEKNMNLAIAANGANQQLSLVKFNENDNSQKWIFKDSAGVKINIKDAMPTAIGITEDKYEKTGVVYSVGGINYYEAKTTEEYNGVSANTPFYLNANNAVVTNQETLNKLFRFQLFESMRNTFIQCVESYAVDAQNCYDVYCNIRATEKLGNIIGTGSGVLLKLGTGNPCTLGDAAVEIAGDIDLETIKNTVLLSYLQIYTNNCIAHAEQMINLSSKEYTDYETALSAMEAYIACEASWEVVKSIADDEVKKLSKSSPENELKKYFANVFVSLADSIIPDIDSVKIVKYISDGFVSLVDFYADSGVMQVYEEKESLLFSTINKTYEGAKVTADKLAIGVVEAGTTYVAEGLVDKLAVVQAKYAEGTRVSHSYEFPNTNAWECHGFACYALMSFWGTKKPGISNKTEYTAYKATASESYVNQIRPGDLVRFRSGSYDHTIVVTNVDDDNIYYADCNSDLNCTFRYNKIISKAELAQKLIKTLNDQQVSTRGYILHYKNNNL